MKKLSAYLLFFYACVSSAQTNAYHAFPDSNAVWNELTGGCCTSSCPGPPTPNPVMYDYKFSYFIEGDTSINSLSYHKLYQSGWWRSYCYYSGPPATWSPMSKMYVGGYRQDTALRKVFWFGNNSWSECLLLDFALQVGDSVKTCMTGCPGLTVSSIDSVHVANGYRKRWNFTEAPTVSWIEGIGSTNGLLEPICIFEYGGTLTCFAQDGLPVYPDTSTNCDILTSVHPSERTVSLDIIPNPVVNGATVRFGINLYNANVSLRNTLGEEQFVIHNFSGTELPIHRKNLPAGIYLLEVTVSGVRVASKKVMIE